MSNRQIAENFLTLLEEDFVIHPRVEGKHLSGKIMQLDAIVKPRDNFNWKNKHVALGVVFADSELVTENYTKWLTQLVDYRNTEWNGFGYVYIFVCPGIMNDIPANIVQDKMFFTQFFGQLGIGELINSPEYGLAFNLHGTRRIWSKRNSAEKAKIWSLDQKIGCVS